MVVARTLAAQYKPYLCAIMAFKDGRPTNYPPTIEFSREQLLSITADDVTHHFNYMAFHTTTPGPEDHSTHCRSSTLDQAKKAISYFMPNKHIAWNVDTNTGNPTRSPQVTAVIRLVKRNEVRQQGRRSSARRELTMAEFRLTVRLLEDAAIVTRSFDMVVKAPCMMKLQVHIIGRTDDITNIRADSLKSHSRFHFCLQIKLNWSKNVMEERNCPWQILLGSADVDFCVLLGTLTLFVHMSVLTLCF